MSIGNHGGPLDFHDDWFKCGICGEVIGRDESYGPCSICEVDCCDNCRIWEGEYGWLCLDCHGEIYLEQRR